MAGIYIHIPFCKQACSYCNFHFSVSLKSKEAFLAVLEKEIFLTTDFIDDRKIETIYFGGGTPSILEIGEIENILHILKNNFDIHPDAEITLEANPDDISVEKCKQWLNLGINRLSLGLQSFNEVELKWMNRAHKAAESVASIEHILQAGFTNFSVDLIYGSPLQSNEDLLKNIEILSSFNVPHISCYALTVEPKTKLNTLINQKKSPDIDPTKQSEQFHLSSESLARHGYQQYEISSFCKPGFESKHNSSYWKSKPYFGFGPSAHSYNGTDKRRWNISNNALYIQSLSKNTIPFEEEILTEAQQLNEFIMTSLRTSVGINLETVEKIYGKVTVEKLLKNAYTSLENGKLANNNYYLYLTKEGQFFADGIAGDLFVDEATKLMETP